MRKMMTKKEVENFREKLLIGVGIGVAPAEIKDTEDRKKFRVFASYVLGKVLGLPESEVSE